MTSWYFAFLPAHGLVHLAVWLPPAPVPTSDRPIPPFDPGHSWLQARAWRDADHARVVARRMAVARAALYVRAASSGLIGANGAAGMTAAAASCALALKLAYFNRWVTVGIAIDVVVLLTAIVGGP